MFLGGLDTLAFIFAAQPRSMKKVVPQGRDALVYWEASRIHPVLSRRSRRLVAALAVTASLLFAFPAPSLGSVPASGRAWEVVTSREPVASTVWAIHPLRNGGDRVAYISLGPVPGSPSGSLISSATASRGSTGWTNEPQGFPYSTFTNELFSLLAPELAAGFTEDLRPKLWLAAVPLTPDAPPEGQLGLYEATDGPPRLIAKVGEGNTFGYSGFVDISASGEEAIFTTAEHLLSAEASRTSGESIYAWDGSTMRLVDVDSGGALLSSCGSSVSSANGMSTSGRRVFFTAPATGACGGTKKVYMRDLAAGTTTEISASQCARVDCDAPQNVSFASATPDGSSAFLVTAQQLTNDDEDSGRDLYRYDVSTGKLHLLSGGSPEASGQVDQAVVYPSDDGSRTYFRATGAMTPGEASGEKLFLADESGMHLVAAASFPAEPEIQLSSSGERAIFVTASKVVESDTDSRQDVYLYDADEGAVTRISAGPSGGNEAINANLSSPLALPELEAGVDHPIYGIDASGDRVVFATSEPLVPEDSERKARRVRMARRPARPGHSRGRRSRLGIRWDQQGREDGALQDDRHAQLAGRRRRRRGFVRRPAWGWVRRAARTTLGLRGRRLLSVLAGSSRTTVSCQRRARRGEASQADSPAPHRVAGRRAGGRPEGAGVLGGPQARPRQRGGVGGSAREEGDAGSGSARRDTARAGRHPATAHGCRQAAGGRKDAPGPSDGPRARRARILAPRQVEPWRSAMSRRLLVLAWSATAMLVAPALAAPAADSAEFGIVPGSLEAETLDGEGNPDSRAGAHPDHLRLAFRLTAEGTGTSTRDQMLEFGPGFGGSPSAVPLCARSVFAEEEACPAGSQVGVFKTELAGTAREEPLYNVAPAPGQLAVFGTRPFWKTPFELDLRPQDYGLRFQTSQFPQFASDWGEIELWGIPADHLGAPPPERAALLTTPTRCGGLKVTLRVRSWEVDAPWLSETTETPAFTGCEDSIVRSGTGLRAERPDRGLAHGRPDRAQSPRTRRSRRIRQRPDQGCEGRPAAGSGDLSGWRGRPRGL